MSAKRFASVLPLVALAAIVACSDDDTTTPSTTPPTTTPPTTTPEAGTSTTDIVDTAAATPALSTLVGAVQAAGLVETLKGTGPFTVFAPTNDAFAKLPSFLTTQLVTAPYKTELGLILKYHVISGTVRAADLAGKTSMPATVAGGMLSVDGTGTGVTVNGSVNVTTADVAASNGIVHVVDGVLLPTIVDTAKGYDDGTTKFATLVGALTTAELAETLAGPGPFTVFAPTDAAFAKLPAGTLAGLSKTQLANILKAHVVSGQPAYKANLATGPVTTLNGQVNVTVGANGVTVQAQGSSGAASNVVLADLPTSNGVVHVIDTVILPPG